ncbi:late embryogenesis abundant protein 1 [Quercus suber]|uniref:late embryogenesis abundant protein 1 n=1 Tax=Quercus suber TaxID=58331 RepID=UPI0032DF8138
MASAKQNYKSGQAHGQGQAKTEEWVQSTKDTANAAKDRTANATQSTKDKTTSAAQSAQESAQYGKDQSAGFLQQEDIRGATLLICSCNRPENRQTTSAAQSAQESAQHGKDQSVGFLQQTGEQVKNMAQNAVDNVKNTIGMDENNAKK